MEMFMSSLAVLRIGLQIRTIRNIMMHKMSGKSNSSLAEAASGPPAAAPVQPVVESRDLLGARGEVVIRHEGRLYHLRRTRLGKLILTA
ncbi:MAG: hemin uptake protein HemP [Usitatibacter sp.]